MERLKKSLFARFDNDRTALNSIQGGKSVYTYQNGQTDCATWTTSLPQGDVKDVVPTSPEFDTL
jgi:hypothetical protein